MLISHQEVLLLAPLQNNVNITTCNIYPIKQKLVLGTVLLPHETGPIYGSLASEKIYNNS